MNHEQIKYVEQQLEQAKQLSQTLHDLKTLFDNRNTIKADLTYRIGGADVTLNEILLLQIIEKGTYELLNRTRESFADMEITSQIPEPCLAAE